MRLKIYYRVFLEKKKFWRVKRHHLSLQAVLQFGQAYASMNFHKSITLGTVLEEEYGDSVPSATSFDVEEDIDGYLFLGRFLEEEMGIEDPFQASNN